MRRDQGMLILSIEAWVARERITAPTPPPDYRGKGVSMCENVGGGAYAREACDEGTSFGEPLGG